MAANQNNKPKTQNANTKQVAKPQTATVKKETATVAPKAETAVKSKQVFDLPEEVKVKFKMMSCSPYGTFYNGDIRTLKRETAESLVSIGVAEKVE